MRPPLESMGERKAALGWHLERVGTEGAAVVARVVEHRHVLPREHRHLRPAHHVGAGGVGESISDCGLSLRYTL